MNLVIYIIIEDKPNLVYRMKINSTKQNWKATQRSVSGDDLASGLLFIIK